MRRNRIKSRDEKKALKREDDFNNKSKECPHICKKIVEPDISINLDYHDILNIINESHNFEEVCKNTVSVLDSEDVITALKNIMNIMQYPNKNSKKQEKNYINDISSGLNFRFIGRESNKNIFLPAILNVF